MDVLLEPYLDETHRQFREQCRRFALEKIAPHAEAWEEAGTQAKWDGSSWAKKLAKKKARSGLSDFDRFKVMVAKKQKAEIIAKKMAELS